MRTSPTFVALGLVAVTIAVVASAVFLWPEELIRDDAMIAGLDPADFPALEVDVFAELDQGIVLSPEAIRGRNTWILWTAGSQVFVDWLAREGYGLSDTLKMLDSRRRGSRFSELGLVNEPGFVEAAQPDELGIWLDVPAGGAASGSVDQSIEEAGLAPRVYGRSTGVLGLRLFPNPDFDERAMAAWDAERFYDPADLYSRDPSLVRPYRVGMTCGLCHVAPNPLRPPADPNDPQWGNLVSLLGNQYFREGRVFASNLKPPSGKGPSSFLWELFNAQPAGTSDTSRMATDHINNPNAINAIFNVDARMSVALEVPQAKELLGDSSLTLPSEVQAPSRLVPHILKDGADSVGLAGAALRVYVNIGLFSQYWLTLHAPLLGIRRQEPFEVARAAEDSVYWQATVERMPDLEAFFRSIGPYRLEDAAWIGADGEEHSGMEYLSADREVLAKGRLAFARECAACHSSKRPPQDLDPGSLEVRSWFETSVASDDFRDNNYLSEDKRHSISRVRTNACRALATNATRGRIWDIFSSETYKQLPSPEKISIYNPFNGEDGDLEWSLRDREVRHAVGYYRTPSLISLWSSAPFLHNNSLGLYNGDPSVAGRLVAFEDAAEKLLWPERRLGPGSIWRTTRKSSLKIPLGSLPESVSRRAVRAGLVREGTKYVEIGPIPAGIPINLLASLDLSLGSLGDTAKALSLARLAVEIREVLAEVDERELENDGAVELMKARVLPLLMKNSNCPDLVEDRGHYFGTGLADDDKWALIEFLKTL